MHTFAQKPKPTQQTKSANSTKPGWVPSGQSREVRFILHLQRTIGNQAVQRLLRANPAILHLQRTIGNQAVQRLLKPKTEDLEASSARNTSTESAHVFSRIPVQASVRSNTQSKLKVNNPGDIYEQEANRIADQVMRMSDPQPQRACACGGECPRCRKEQCVQQHLQTKSVQGHDPGETTVPPVTHEVTYSGQPLDSETRAFFEPRFGHDFNQVRVHTNAKATESAQAINAVAYTVGLNIVFGAGKSPGKNTLTAHELIHVLQQGNATNRSRAPIVQRDHTKESERPAITREVLLRDLRQRIIERAVEKTCEIGEALRNGYIWPNVETAPGVTLTVEVMDQWSERNQRLQQLLLWLGDFIERIRAGQSYHNLRPDQIDTWVIPHVQERTYFSSNEVRIHFYDEARMYLHNVHNVSLGEVFIGRVLYFPPNRTPASPPSLRTGQAPSTPTTSGPPQSRPRAPRRPRTLPPRLTAELPFVYVPDPNRPEHVEGILTRFGTRLYRPNLVYQLYRCRGDRYCYNRGGRWILLPSDLPQRFPSLRQRGP